MRRASEPVRAPHGVAYSPSSAPAAARLRRRSDGRAGDCTRIGRRSLLCGDGGHARRTRGGAGCRAGSHEAAGEGHRCHRRWRPVPARVGFGDPKHNHTGPPGLNKTGAALPPPTVKKVDNKAVIVTTSLNVDEQAALYFSVLTKTGKQLLIVQKGSTIGESVSGEPAKTIHYVMLIPRTIPVALRSRRTCWSRATPTGSGSSR